MIIGIDETGDFNENSNLRQFLVAAFKKSKEKLLIFFMIL